MNDLLIVLLLALATLKVTDFVGDLVPGLKGAKTILTFIIGVGGVVALDYSIFAGYGIETANGDLGVWVTGLIVVGATTFTSGVMTYLTRGTKTTSGTGGHLSKAA